MTRIFQIVATESPASMWPGETLDAIIHQLAGVETDLRELDRIGTTHKPRDEFTRAATGTAYVSANRLASIQHRLATITFPKPGDLPNPTEGADPLYTATRMLSQLAVATLNFYEHNYADREQLAICATAWLISIGANHLSPTPPADITLPTDLNE